MLKEKVGKYLKAHDEAKTQFDNPTQYARESRGGSLMLLSKRVDVLVSIIREIVEWVDKVEQIEILARGNKQKRGKK